MQDFAADDEITQKLASRLNEVLLVDAFKYIEQGKLEQAEAYVKGADALAVYEEAVVEVRRLLTEARSASAVTLKRRVNPKYPQSAMLKEVEGWVQVAFQVGGNGKVFDVKVVEAEPEGIFDKAAIKAVKKWRYEVSENVVDRDNFSVVKAMLLKFQLEE